MGLEAEKDEGPSEPGAAAKTSESIPGQPGPESGPEASPAEHPAENTADKPARSDATLLGKLTGTPLRKAGTALGTIVTGAVTAIVAGLVLGWFGGNSSAPAATQQIIFQPWATSGSVSPDVHIVSRVTGTCWTSSSITSRPDAYRCMADNDIFDPCISNPTADTFSKQVICPYPGPESATVVTLESALPGEGGTSTISSFRPWLLTLSDGENCFAFSAFTQTTAGLGEDYTCPDGGLYNGIRRGSQPWTIFQLRKGSSDMTLAKVAKAYF